MHRIISIADTDTQQSDALLIGRSSISGPSIAVEYSAENWSPGFSFQMPHFAYMILQTDQNWKPSILGNLE